MVHIALAHAHHDAPFVRRLDQHIVPSHVEAHHAHHSLLRRSDREPKSTTTDVYTAWVVKAIWTKLNSLAMTRLSCWTPIVEGKGYLHEHRDLECRHQRPCSAT